MDNTSETPANWYEQFTPEQRKVLILLVAYETERKKRQFGYKAWRKNDLTILNLPVFKQGATLVTWLEEQGKDITWTDKDWQGYVRYAFKHFAPRVPFLGQLKNKAIYNLYRSHGFKRKLNPTMTREQLAERYKQFLRPELQDDSVLRALGLQGTDEPDVSI